MGEAVLPCRIQLVSTAFCLDLQIFQDLLTKDVVLSEDAWCFSFSARLSLRRRLGASFLLRAKQVSNCMFLRGRFYRLSCWLPAGRLCFSKDWSAASNLPRSFPAGAGHPTGSS